MTIISVGKNVENLDPHILLRGGAKAVENIPQRVKQSYPISQEFYL